MSGPRQTDARMAAYEALLDVERGAYVNLRLKELQGLDERDRAFAYALVHEVLDRRIALDFLIDHYARGSLKTPVRIALRMGVCQLLYMDVPESAAVNESVALVKKIGKGALGGVVNGILRSIARDKDDLPRPTGDAAAVMSVELSWPQWLVERLIAQMGAEQAALVLSRRQPRPMSFCANALVSTAEAVEAELDRRGVAFERGELVKDSLRAKLRDVGQDELFTSGAILVQGEASMLVADAVGAARGMKVLDACSAPGGKAIRMAMGMGADGDGKITAWDLHEHRVELVRANARRCGADCIEASVRDAAVFDPALEGKFDAVLVDAPCSGLGVAGKSDVRYAKTPEIVAQLQQTQRAILDCCARYVKPGGVLVYATCTLLREENGDNFAHLLETHPEFARGDLRPHLPEGFDASRAAGGELQLLPHLDGTDGFYIAKAVRT